MKTDVAAVVIRCNSFLICLLLCSLPSLAAVPDVVFDSADPLPAIIVNGEKVKLHTQGLFVTDRHYLVTARLERKPKRAMLVRFERGTKKYEVLDITPPLVQGQTLDHPGGFDRADKNSFWIPLSTSHRRGPSRICRYRIRPDESLEQAELESSFDVNDHVGAICRLKDGALLAANWDTERILTFFPDGELMSQVDQATTLYRGRPYVAVQDWKQLYPGTNLVAMGALDRSARPRKSVVAVFDMHRGECIGNYRLARRENVRSPVANEGMHVFDGMLYLLPEDLSDGAKVLRYRFPDLRASGE